MSWFSARPMEKMPVGFSSDHGFAKAAERMPLVGLEVIFSRAREERDGILIVGYNNNNNDNDNDNDNDSAGIWFLVSYGVTWLQWLNEPTSWVCALQGFFTFLFWFNHYPYYNTYNSPIS